MARERVPGVFRPVVADVISEFELMDAPTAELHLYGSVATGMARPGRSDVDLVVIDGAPGWATDVGARMTQRYATLCRGVEIGLLQRDDHAGPGDEAYGNRVFLRHYCVSLAGPDAIRPRASFAADVRAARGFNGDIVRCLERWRAGDASPRAVARKTLVTAAGILSIRNGTWTTDRTVAVDAWTHIDGDEAADLRRLLGWAEGTRTARVDELAAALSPDGIVHAVAERFADEIGLWA